MVYYTHILYNALFWLKPKRLHAKAKPPLGAVPAVRIMFSITGLGNFSSLKNLKVLRPFLNSKNLFDLSTISA